jgi:hypothetical protein
MTQLKLVLAACLSLAIAACGGQEKSETVLAAKAPVGTACIVPSPCWMTAGGAKFEPSANLRLATRGPRVSFGGNVAPGCDLDPGAGGQWNHVDHDLKLHFQGFVVTDVACDGLPTDSPDAPVNHITFNGTGRVQGIEGLKGVPASYESVCFTAQAIDWAEPATKTDPMDQYFIRVWDCNGTGLDILSLGTAEAPITITDGNIQIHPCF